MVQTTSRRAILTTTLGGLVVALSACTADGGPSGDSKKPLSKDNKASITVGVLPIATVAPLYAAQSQGFFEDAGLEVEIQTAAGAPQLTAAIQGGSYHLAYTAPTPFLLAASQGIAVTAIAANDIDNQKNPLNQILVSSDSSISDLRGLAGKTVAVNTLGGILQATTMAAIKKAGVDPSQVKFIPLPFQQMLNALSQGRADAVVTTEPFVTQGLGAANKSISNPIHEVLPGGVNGLWYTTTTYAEGHPQEIAAFRKAIAQGLAYIEDHPEEARKIVGGFTKIPAQGISAMAMPAWATDRTTDAVVSKSLQDQVDLLDEFKILKGKVDTTSLVWPRD